MRFFLSYYYDKSKKKREKKPQHEWTKVYKGLKIIFKTVDYGTWFDYVANWERFLEEHPNYPIHIMYYEDTIKVNARMLKLKMKSVLARVIK